MSIKFDREKGPFGHLLLAWWSDLEEDRASRAILKRAPTVTAVSLTPPYQRFFRRLSSAAGGTDHIKLRDFERLAAIAGLAAHIKTDDSIPLAERMSTTPMDSDKAPVSELRFLKLLAADDIDTLFIGMRRVLPLMKHQANVIALANDVMYWEDRVKKQWAYSYHWPAKSSN